VGIVPDRYDELRREWIHNHWAWSEIQRARVEKLDIQIRRRFAESVLAAPSRRDDLARNPLAGRGHSSSIGQLEWAAFWVMLVFVPVGWLAGKGIYRLLVSLVPGVLRSYPIVALLWYALIPGIALTVLYDPGPGLTSKLLAPWVVAQMSAALLVAGVYGIVEGWLAVPGSLQFWPTNPPALQMNAVDAAEVLGADDVTGPPLIPPAAPPNLGGMTPPMRSEVRRR
jgi:hypothetical protein